MIRTERSDDVVITGMGVVSPFGHSIEALVRGLEAPSTARLRAPEVVADIPISAVPEAKRSRVGRLDRLCRVFLAASYLAVDSAGLRIGADAVAPERVGLSFGTGFGCLETDAEYNSKIVAQGPGAASPRLFAYTVSSAAAGEVSIALGIKGPNVTQHMGFAAGLGAIGYAFDLIQMGKADVVLAGGADVVGPALLQGLRDMGFLKSALPRPFHDTAPGVYPTEGALVAVLERRDRAERRGARLYAQIDGYAAGFEPTLTRRNPECAGLVATARRALSLSGHIPAEVDAVFGSAHGTPLDTVERAAIREVFGVARAPLVLAPKAVLGESFGASGALALGLAAACFTNVPAFAGGVAFDADGEPLPSAVAAQRLHNASLVMISSMCYSGPIVNALLARVAP